MNVVGLVITVLHEIKVICDDNEFSNEQCKGLLHHCADLSHPIRQIQEKHDFANSQSAALTTVLSLLVEVRKFCDKFKNRGVFKTLTHHSRDKDKFIAYHRKIDSAVSSFNLQVIHVYFLFYLSHMIYHKYYVTAVDGEHPHQWGLE